MKTAEKRKLRPEAVMGIIAACQILILAIVLVLAMPHMGGETGDDPLYEIMQNPPATTEPAAPTEEPLPEPEKNPYTQRDFQFDGRFLTCLRADTVPGVDVSYYQGDIDWEQVADAGVKFAMIRVGYRGYGTGKLVEDEKFVQNIEGALAAGLDVGVYFFSQALNEQEALEEADFMLERIAGYDITMPVVFDWEYVNDEARTANMDRRTLTDCTLAFCEYMQEKGYQPMCYFNTYQMRNDLNLWELEEYPFWLALYKNRMTFPYAIEMWQYTCTGKVPGIAGDVDINIYFP